MLDGINTIFLATPQIFVNNFGKPAAFLKRFNLPNVSSIGHGGFASEYKRTEDFHKVETLV